MDFMQHLLQVSLMALVFELAAAGLEGRDRTVLLREFSAARRYIHFIFTVKMSYWQTPPWILFGAAHHDEDIARRCARSALQQFLHLGVGQVLHWVTLLFCTPGTALYDEFVAFATGRARDTLIVLQRWLARFAFALTSERCLLFPNSFSVVIPASPPHRSFPFCDRPNFNWSQRYAAVWSSS